MFNMHNGTIQPAQHNGFRMYRAQYNNQTEFFYTMSLAAWWIEMLDTIAESRRRRNAH